MKISRDIRTMSIDALYNAAEVWSRSESDLKRLRGFLDYAIQKADVPESEATAGEVKS